MIYSLGSKHPVFAGEYYIADDATIIGDVRLGDQASIWFKSILRGDTASIRIGAGTNIQDACVLHVDEGVPLTIGARVSVGHQVMLHGCSVEDGCLIGINAVILNHAVIGENCLIGANTLIPEGKKIPPGSLVVGSPGRVARQLEAEEITLIHSIAEHYIEQAREYRAHLKSFTPDSITTHKLAAEP